MMILLYSAHAISCNMLDADGTGVCGTLQDRGASSWNLFWLDDSAFTPNYRAFAETTARDYKHISALLSVTSRVSFKRWLYQCFRCFSVARCTFKAKQVSEPNATFFHCVASLKHSPKQYKQSWEASRPHGHWAHGPAPQVQPPRRTWVSLRAWWAQRLELSMTIPFFLWGVWFEKVWLR